MPRNAGKEKPQKADMTAGSLTHSRRAAAPPCTPARRAKQAKQRQQKPRTHKRTEGERQAAAAQARPSQTQKQQAAHKPGPRQRHTGRKDAGAPGTKVLTTAAGRARTTSPADGAAHRMQKNPSEQAKLAFALLPARRGLVNRGRQKIASLFLAGTVFFCCALLISARFAARSAEQKGAPPPFIPRSLLKKTGENFTVLAVCSPIASVRVPPAGSPAAPRRPEPAKTPPPPAIAPR